MLKIQIEKINNTASSHFTFFIISLFCYVSVANLEIIYDLKGLNYVIHIDKEKNVNT